MLEVPQTEATKSAILITGLRFPVAIDTGQASSGTATDGKESISCLYLVYVLLNPLKIHRFHHERISKRVTHARGAGAFGTFKLYESASDVSKACVRTDASRTRPIFSRFSTVLGSRGNANAVRDARGFAVKLYTEEENWDIVDNNIPVFIQDTIKFSDISESIPLSKLWSLI